MLEHRIPEKPVTCVIIGAGQRGRVYARYAEDHPAEWKVVGVAEPLELRQKQMAEKHGDKRRTEIVDVEDETQIEDLIEKEEVVVTMTTKGYVKRIPLDEYKSQGRGGTGKRGMATQEQDVIRDCFTAHSHDDILCFTSLGKVYPLKVYRIPEGTRVSKGKAIVNLLGCPAID